MKMQTNNNIIHLLTVPFKAITEPGVACCKFLSVLSGKVGLPERIISTIRKDQDNHILL